jgi:hypothetical protein
LYAKEIYVRLRDERRICLVELIDAKQKEKNDRKRLAACTRTSIGETHHSTFIVAVCTLRPASVLIIPNDVRHRHAGSRRHYLRDAVQAVVTMKVRLRVAHRYTHTVHLHREAERLGREVTRRLRADRRRVKTRALEALPVSPSVAKAS